MKFKTMLKNLLENNHELKENSIPRTPETDELIKKGKVYELYKTEPYGPNGKYQDFYIKFEGSLANTVFSSEKEALEYLKKQEYK